MMNYDGAIPPAGLQKLSEVSNRDRMYTKYATRGRSVSSFDADERTAMAIKKVYRGVTNAF